MYNFTGKSPWCTGKKTDLTNSSIISQIVPLQMYVKLNYTKTFRYRSSHTFVLQCIYVYECGVLRIYIDSTPRT